MREHPRVWAAATGELWLCTRAGVEEVTGVLEQHRNASAEQLDSAIEAMERTRGEPLEYSERATVRDGVAILPIRGPLFRYANMMTRFSGATSYGTAALDLDVALTDPAVRAILLQVDSPGGAWNGLLEFTTMIHRARDVKPVVAYIGGDGCSAAFAIAAAADKVYAAAGAIVGCLGAVLRIEDYSEAERKAGIKEYVFVSEQTPNKVDDPRDPAGAARIQAMINRIGGLYLNATAGYLGLSVAQLLEKTQDGGILVGEDAAAAGLVTVSTFEDVLAQMASDAAGMGGDPATDDPGRPFPHLLPMESSNMADPNQGAGQAPALSTVTAEQLAAENPTLVNALRAEGATTERTRILAIQQHGRDLPGNDALITQMVNDGTVTADAAAARLIAAQRQQREAAQQNLAGDEAALVTAGAPAAAPTPETPNVAKEGTPAGDAEAAKKTITNAAAVLPGLFITPSTPARS